MRHVQEAAEGLLREFEETDMTGVAEYGTVLASPSRDSDPQVTRKVPPALAVFHWLPVRWGCAVVLVAGLPTLLFNSPSRDIEEVVRLERLIPKVERAQNVSAEARAAIGRLIARQSSLANAGDHAREARRKAAIDRLLKAMQHDSTPQPDSSLHEG
jgi:hypothetical protein